MPLRTTSSDMLRKLNMAKVLFLFLFLFLAVFCRSERDIVSEPIGFSLNVVRTTLDDKFNDFYFSNKSPPNFIFSSNEKLGTPSVERKFLLDTDSSLTCTQCIPCIDCTFNQTSPPFDPKKSSSYKKLSSNDSLTRYFDMSNNGEYTFNVTYVNGLSVAGTASTETFYIRSVGGTRAIVKGVVFGCANYFDWYYGDPPVTGVLGMNRSPISVISQLGPKSLQRFSYCFQKFNSSDKIVFRFGKDVKKKFRLQKTNFVWNHRDDYNVDLLGISIAGRRLSLPGRSTCRLNMQNVFSSVKNEVYKQVLEILEDYFKRFDLSKVGGSPNSNGDLCYGLRREFKHYPKMVLHFQGANYKIRPPNLFHFMKDRFCLALSMRTKGYVLGAHQMQNMRFIYDSGNNKLLFGREDCSKDKL